jgi:hypothetical protein
MLVGCKFLIGSPKLDRLQGRGQKKDGPRAFGLSLEANNLTSQNNVLRNPMMDAR